LGLDTIKLTIPNTFYIHKMDSVVNYLDDTEKKLMKEMGELFSKMREQRDTLSLQGIEDMYTYTPVEGVLYEPCVRIPGPPALGGYYYCTAYKLPQDEYVIFVKKFIHCGSQYSPGNTYACIAITNYGRFIRTYPIRENRQFGGYNSYAPAANNNEINDASHGQSPSGTTSIIKLDPLSYKLPNWFLKSFITHDVLYADPNGQNSVFYTGTNQHPNTLTESLNNTTNSLQELNKEFYLFAGKWKPHMTEHATLDIDTMRQTIIENTKSIEQLKANKESLEQQNIKLQAELTALREQKATLEKEQAKLLPLEKYKEAVLEFMDDHYTGGKPYDHDNTLDTDIIRYFSDWHYNKVFLEESVYDDIMESKEELNEYRIYKKVKGEMVSTGMDNSSVARNVNNVAKNVRTIKKGVKQLNSN